MLPKPLLRCRSARTPRRLELHADPAKFKSQSTRYPRRYTSPTGTPIMAAPLQVVARPASTNSPRVGSDDALVSVLKPSTIPSSEKTIATPTAISSQVGRPRISKPGATPKIIPAADAAATAHRFTVTRLNDWPSSGVMRSLADFAPFSARLAATFPFGERVTSRCLERLLTSRSPGRDWLNAPTGAATPESHGN